LNLIYVHFLLTLFSEHEFECSLFSLIKLDFLVFILCKELFIKIIFINRALWHALKLLGIHSNLLSVILEFDLDLCNAALINLFEAGLDYLLMFSLVEIRSEVTEHNCARCVVLKDHLRRLGYVGIRTLSCDPALFQSDY